MCHTGLPSQSAGHEPSKQALKALPLIIVYLLLVKLESTTASGQRHNMIEVQTIMHLTKSDPKTLYNTLV